MEPVRVLFVDDKPGTRNEGFCVDGQVSPRPPPRKFVRKVISDGQIVSTCVACQTVFPSATPTDLRTAEAAHECGRKGFVTALAPCNVNLFERKLLERADRTFIESHCKRCGQILLGKTIFGDLLEQEQQHMVQCGQA